MSGFIIGDDLWGLMSEAERTTAVQSGHATLRQLAQGLLDGPEELRAACRHFLAHTGTNLSELPLAPDQQEVRSSISAPEQLDTYGSKQKLGLPDGFVARSLRSGRTSLIPENIYRLPNGKEFVPAEPSGPIGRGRHLYALLDLANDRNWKRGSVYVRTDGRIFDYSVDSTDPNREFFDTGYTVDDLERTGRYSTSREKVKAVRERGPRKRKGAKAGKA